ncbi:MAG: DnaJ domain-containing protein [Alphaproteobacteria bacterium]|nr:DnaJ domain-containing protein [Alphaproteobacteria bacterium]
MSWDPYAMLGVPKSASAEDIKKAYRKLAKELHPDVRPNDKASEDRFKRVTAAFNLLTDTTQRARFDRGEIDADGNERPTFQPGAGFGGGFAGARATRGQRGDVFEDLFDGLFSRGGTRGFAAQRGEDVRYRMDIDFLDAVNGGRRRVTMSDGRSLDLAIPAGINSGQTLRLKGQGLPGVGGGPAGDALVEVSIGAHPVFRREDDDIRMDLRISLAEAVEGGKVPVTTPSGPVSLTIPAGSNSGEVLKLRGKGVQTRPNPGDLLVRLLIVLPDKDDQELKAFVKKWGKRAQDVQR